MARLVLTNVYEACGKETEEGSWGKMDPTSLKHRSCTHQGGCGVVLALRSV